MQNVKLIVLAMFAVAFLAGCASDDQKDYSAYKNMSSKEILKSGEKSMYKRNYSDASKKFEAVDALYPFDKETQQADLDSIYSYYKEDDDTAALAAAEKYIHLYPNSNHTDYAYYMKGLINFQRGKTWIQKIYRASESERDLNYMHQAFVDFSDMVRLFPDSLYVTDAYERMLYIKSMFAQRELDVAKFYFDRKAYVAAANRAGYVVRHFEGTPQVIEALKLMAKSYHILGAQQQEDDVLRILKNNYPSVKVWISASSWKRPILSPFL